MIVNAQSTTEGERYVGEGEGEGERLGGGRGKERETDRQRPCGGGERDIGGETDRQTD